MTINGTSTRPTERNDIVGIANEVASEKHGGIKDCKNPKVIVITWSNSVDVNSQKETNGYVQQQSNLIPSNVVNAVDDDRCNDDNVDNDDEEIDRIAKLNAAAAEAIIYLQTKEQRWEMTWPIWHMLPRHERKDIALQYGYKTIGEFEEYMSLRQAFGDSSIIHQDDLQQSSSSQQQIRSSSSKKHPYPNQLLYEPDSKPSSSQQTNDEELKRTTNVEEDEEETDNLECQFIEKELDMEKEHEIISSIDQNLSSIELIKVGGIILLIPEDILHKVFAWLPADTYATLALVSKHWKYFTRTEHVYKRLCERLYLIQSKRKVLHVHKFHNSYRTMLEIRPRVRAGGGVYVMKYSEIRRIQRDMWTEIPHGAILESVYYRYLYFQEDGTVLYALTSSPPHEMFPRFRHVLLRSNSSTSSTNPMDRSIVWGTYNVQKYNVIVKAKQPWQYVHLEMTICPEYNKLHGRFGYLSFDKHMTSSAGNWDDDCVTYKVPIEPFRFIQDRRL